MIYIAIWEDRHSDTTAHPFRSAEKAIEWAKKKAKEFDRFNDYKEDDLTEGMKHDGWIFSCTYSVEDDGIRIVAVEFEDQP